MSLSQAWRVSTGEASAEVQSDNWLGALAQGLPEVGLDLGAMARLVCALEEDGSATARDPRAGLEVRIVPLGAPTPPSFDMPSSSFAALYAPQLRVTTPEEPKVEPASLAEPAPSVPSTLRSSPTLEIEGRGFTVATPVPVVDVALEDRLEDLFMRLGDISEAGSISEACAAALRIAAELVPCDAGCVLVRTRAGDGLRFRAALGPASKAVVDTVIPLDKGIAGFAFQLGLALTIEDAKRDERHYGRVDKSTGYQTRSVLAAPIRADEGGVYGCLELINPPRAFNADDLEVATRVAASLGSYLRAGAASG